jgi:hypothetical protein
MTARLSTGLVNSLMSVGSFADAFAGGVIDIYSGTQPATADTAASGTKLVTLTAASGAYTAETRASGTVTLATGAAGSVDTVTVNSIDILGASVPYNTSLTQTATDVAAQINRNPKNRTYVATSSGAVITLTANAGFGTSLNGHVVTATLTTLTASYANIASGVAAVNGLNYESSVAGVVSKIASQVWSGNAVVSGTAGWFRIRESNDTGVSASTTAVRYDGAIATSGAELNIASLSIVNATPFTATAATFTLPQV